MLNDFKDEDFDSKIKNEDISVVQFSAAWCGPCKALKPVMDTLFKILKAVFKQALNKILKKKVIDYTKIPSQEVSLESLDRFRFDSSRLYSGPQYPGKDQRKGKKDVKKPPTE